MTAWIDVVAHLRAHYTIERETDDWLELRWRFRFEHDELEQHQTVRAGDAFGEPLVLVASEVAAIDPVRALRHNATLAIGALAIEHGKPILRHGIVASALNMPHLDRVLCAVAEEAARLTWLSRQDVTNRPNPFARQYADAK